MSAVLGERARWLPRLDEVDRRFKRLRADRLENEYLVPDRIHFPTGVIGAGALWPPKGITPQWYRSDGNSGGALPRMLSDRLKIQYEKIEFLTLKSCQGNTLIKLKPKPDRNSRQVVLGNYADAQLSAKDGDGYADLTYLFWYYRLGSWDTPYGVCPDYTDGKAVLLRCLKESGRRCWCSDDSCDADSKFWPPMLGSGSY